MAQVSRVWSDSLLVKVQRSINGIQMACSVWFDAIVQHLQNCEETKVVAGLGQYSADNCGQSHLHSDEIFWSGRHGMARAWCRVVSGQLESVHRPLSPDQQQQAQWTCRPVVLWSSMVQWSCGPVLLWSRCARPSRRHRRQSFSLIPSSVKEQLCQGL